MSTVTSFIKHHYRHFNAAALIDAAEAYNKLLKGGGKMFVTLAGAMSTAELGLSLAEMIRQDKVHGICCTGANLEEDVFNLVAHDHYERVPHYRDLTPADEWDGSNSTIWSVSYASRKQTRSGGRRGGEALASARRIAPIGG